MIQINIDNEEVFAMINYARDVAMGCEPLGTWNEMRSFYMSEAECKECQENYVLTQEEVERVLASFLKK